MNILYIEDNNLNFRLVQKMLKSEHEVFGAINGGEGIKEVEELMPDLILLDINLPDFDGFKVQEIIREESRFNHIPIIALTANSMFGDRERILEAGFEDYLAKPVTRIELKRAVTKHLPVHTFGIERRVESRLK